MTKIHAIVLRRHTHGDEDYAVDRVIALAPSQLDDLAGVGLVRKATAKEVAQAKQDKTAA